MSSADNPNRVVLAAMPLVDLNARTGLDAYAAALLPGETASRALELAQLSGCGFTGAAALRGAGYCGEELAAPYVIGTAISRLVKLAGRWGAWKFDAAVMTPPGGVHVIGGPMRGGPEHVQIVIDAQRIGENVWELEVVEGGQLDEHGAQCVRYQRHQAQIIGARIFVGARSRLGWIDAAELPLDEPDPAQAAQPDEA